MGSKSDLRHHGILGQRWGKRNGPPYPLGGGDYSQAERKAIYKKRKQPNSQTAFTTRSISMRF